MVLDLVQHPIPLDTEAAETEAEWKHIKLTVTVSRNKNHFSVKPSND